MMAATTNDGVFPDVVNVKAFIDKVAVAIWGDRRRHPGEGVVTIGKRGIAGPRSRYAQILFCQTADIRNPVSLKYGLLVPRAIRHRFPAAQLIMRSDRMPLTCAEVLGAVDALACVRTRHAVSSVELTFDTSGFSIAECISSLFTTATVSLMEDAEGRETVYIGRPASDWQLRVYEKTDDLIRLEYVFRSPALRRLGIRRVHELSRLRAAALDTLATWKRFREIATVPVLPPKPEYRKRAMLSVMHGHAQGLEKLLRVDYGIRTPLLLEPTALAETLKQMQAKLVW